MKKMFLSAFAVAALAFVGCTEDATNDLAQENGGAAVELHEMTFEAEIEQPTRTSLADPGTGTSYVCWDADDVVGVIAEDGEIYKATIKSGAGTAWATYSVSLPAGVSPAVAFYPYQFARETESGVSVDGDVLNLTLPSIQTYKAGSVFGDDENFMAAYFTDGANGPKCTLKSVMGAFELKFKGSQKVEAITVKASSASQKMSGIASVNPETKALTMGTSVDAYSFVSLEVPEAVTLNSSKTTSFYVLVPAGTYEALQIGVMTEDGSYARTATKTHTVKVGEILPINCGNLDTMIDEGAATNLSANGYANCYVVVPNGAEKTYYFETKYVDGKSITARTYHTETYKDVGDATDPHMAQILWTEDTNVAYDIQFDKANGKIYFKNNGAALGNARIILTCDQINLKPASTPANQLVWAWHIWSTPSELKQSVTCTPYTAAGNSQTTIGGSKNYWVTKDQILNYAKTHSIGLMDRNLGATWTATTVSEVNNMTAQNAADALGMYYQFGNVTPLPRPATFGVSTTAENYSHTRKYYQYGFSKYTQAWSKSSAAKTSLEDHLQHPYYSFNVGTSTYDPTPETAGLLGVLGSYSDTKNNSTGKAYAAGDTKDGLYDTWTPLNKANWIKIQYASGGKTTDTPPALWTDSNSGAAKSNYDPCPPGWRIPHQGNLYQTCQGQGFKLKKEGSSVWTDAISASQRTFMVCPNKSFNDALVGVYITYDGTNVDFHPNGGYAGNGKVTFNKNGNLIYIWGAVYGSQVKNRSGEAVYDLSTGKKVKVTDENGKSVDKKNTFNAYNVGVKGCLHSTVNSSSYTQYWPQPATQYQIRCVKGN